MEEDCRGGRFWWRNCFGNRRKEIEDTQIIIREVTAGNLNKNKAN